jgi:hypothetical protein
MGMQLLVKASRPPSLAISSAGIVFTAPGNVTAFVVGENNTLINVFTLNVTMYASLDVSVQANGSKEIISGKATYLKSDITLLESNIGSFNVSCCISGYSQPARQTDKQTAHIWEG